MSSCDRVKERNREKSLIITEKKKALLNDRRRLEEEFFLKQNTELIKRLKEKKRLNQ